MTSPGRASAPVIAAGIFERVCSDIWAFEVARLWLMRNMDVPNTTPESLRNALAYKCSFRECDPSAPESLSQESEILVPHIYSGNLILGTVRFSKSVPTRLLCFCCAARVPPVVI